MKLNEEKSKRQRILHTNNKFLIRGQINERETKNIKSTINNHTKNKIRHIYHHHYYCHNYNRKRMYK